MCYIYHLLNFYSYIQGIIVHLYQVVIICRQGNLFLGTSLLRPTLERDCKQKAAPVTDVYFIDLSITIQGRMPWKEWFQKVFEEIR